MTPTVDVIVLTWNDGELLDTALRSVSAAAEGLDVNVFVIDNDSHPPARVEEDRRVVLHRSETNLGVAGGRNLGATLGHAPLLCFVDSDAELSSWSLRQLMAPLLADPSIGVVVPVMTGQAAEASAGRRPTLGVKARRMVGLTDAYSPVDRSTDTDWWDVDFGIGACQLIRRSVFDEVDGLDESMYWTEDVDFCLRVREHGHRVVQVRDAGVEHPARRRYRRKLDLRTARHALAMARFLWRHRGAPVDARPRV